MRPLFLLPTLAALALLFPRLVAAQAYSNITRVDVQEMPGGEWKQKKVATPVYVNADECNGTFRFKFAPIASTVSVMEAWVTSTNAICTSSQSRSRVNANEPTCWFAGSESGVNGEFVYELAGSKIFGKGDEGCPTDAIDRVFKVYFVPLPSPTSSSPSAAPEALFNVIKPSAQFTLYTDRPKPPDGIKGRNGNLAVTVSWDRVDNNIRTRYRAFFDYARVEGRECGGGRLDSDNPPAIVDAGVPPVMDDAGTSIDASTPDASSTDPATDAGSTEASTSSEVSAPQLGYPMMKIIDDIKGTEARWGDIESILEVGDTVQVAVATIDATGNVGPLSARACVMRDNSEDFLARCMRDKANCRLGDCNAAPGATGSAFTLSTFALALCALVRRRRRSA